MILSDIPSGFTGLGPKPEEIGPYLDRNGLVTGVSAAKNVTRSPSGNSVMLTSEWMLILHFFYPDMLGPWFEFQRVVDQRLTIDRGIFRRNPVGEPFAEDPMSWDDYVGLAAASAVVGNRAYAKEILAAGRQRRFVWGPLRLPYYYPADGSLEGGEARAWFGRSPSMIAHLKWCAGEIPNVTERLAWAAGIAFAGSKNPVAQDPWRITYLMIQARRASEEPLSWLEKLAIRTWAQELKKSWSRGMYDVRGWYFRDYDHPLARYAVDVNPADMQ